MASVGLGGRVGAPRRRERSVSARCVGVAAAAAETPRSGAVGKVFGRGAEGAWDAAAVGAPVVRCFVGDNEQRWFLWYHGRAGGPHPPDLSEGCVGLATSSDGVQWRRGAATVELLSGGAPAREGTDVGCSLVPNEDWWTFDTLHVGLGDVQILSSANVALEGGIYWMFYTGGDFEELPPSGEKGGDAVQGRRSRIGVALSQDGRNWARVEGPHHTGAVLWGGEKDGDFDARGVFAPRVILNGPKDFMMYYHTECAETGKASIGMATSKDGFQWAKKGSVLAATGEGAEAGGAAHPHVIRTDRDAWLMYYEARDAEGRRAIAAATSEDGTKWHRAGVVLEASSESGAWDAGGVGAPCAVPMAAGKWRLYYAGYAAVGEASSGFGLALSQDDDFTFKRRGQGSE